MDDESHWQRQVLIGLVMLLVVGALIGGIVAFAGIKVANLAGINDTPSTAKSTQRLRVPHNAQTPTSAATTTSSPTAPPSPSSATTTTTSHHPPRHGITLTIRPKTVGSYDKITLSGTYHAPNGSLLQVQRKESGSWADFPTTITVNDGRFSTYVETGQFGANRFRVTDTNRGVSSDTAIVTVL